MDTLPIAGPTFAPTRWSVVLAAGRDSSPQAHHALSALCQSYWYPVYAFIRRRGFNSHDAQDLTQAFFARLLEKRYLARIQRKGGRFRSFLLTAVKRFLANERDRTNALKRGGGQPSVPLDYDQADSRYCAEPAHDLTADKIYEQRWAQALLELVLARLAEDYSATGKSDLFEALSGCLSSSRPSLPYAQIASRLHTTEAAVKMAVRRLRARYRELLRAEIAQTVASPEEVEEEIRHLYATFGP